MQKRVRMTLRNTTRSSEPKRAHEKISHNRAPNTIADGMGNKVKFLVKWNLGDSTWEPHVHCKDPVALDDYLKLHGAQSIQRLLKGSQHT